MERRLWRKRERKERKREGLKHDGHGCVEGQAEHDGNGGRQPGGPGAQALRGYLADEGPAEVSEFAVLAPVADKKSKSARRCSGGMTHEHCPRVPIGKRRR